MYGCLAGPGSKGEEEEEKEEGKGAPPPTANLLLLHGRHCSLSHKIPTCSRKCSKTQTEVSYTLVCEALFRLQEASASPRTSLFSSPSFLPHSSLSFSINQVHALPLVSSL